VDNYNSIQKLLHDLVLGQKFMNKSLFEIEKILYLKNTNITNNRHIFISGLPRSGTTSILNFIYETNEFASLKYTNMPFVLSPNISNLFSKKNIGRKERPHRDGIMYDINSPESFDEIFFNNNNNFIKSELNNFINLVLISQNKKRYLSKNNLNYKRINIITSLLPQSIFLIPIREPVNHAYSLLQQHINFINLQKKDRFIKRYMNYLNHNEFGLNHKSWNMPKKFLETNSLDYWIEQWSMFYTNIYEKYKFNNSCFFIIYEKLSNIEYLKEVIEFLDLKNINKSYENFFKISNKSIDLTYNKSNYDKAYKIYEEFNKI